MERKELGREIHNISNSMKRKIDAKVAEYGLTSVQSRVLHFIMIKTQIEKVPAYQKDIEEVFSIRRSSVTSVLQLLEKNGYIKRESASNDARLKQLTLTKKGDEITGVVHQIIMKEEENLMKSITEEEKELLFSVLEKLSKAISES